MDQKDEKKQNDFVESSARWLGIGIEFVVVVGLFTWIGYKLDKLQNTEPGFMIMGFLVGFGRMIYIMLRKAGFFKDKKRK